MNEKVLEFTIFCVESLAEQLNMSAKKIYILLKFDTDVLNQARHSAPRKAPRGQCHQAKNTQNVK